MWQPHLNVKRHREIKKFGDSNQKLFNRHAFYVSYNVTNVFCSARKRVNGDVRACPQKKLYNYTPLNAGESPSAVIMIRRYQMIMIQSCGLARVDKIDELGEGHCSHATPCFAAVSEHFRICNR